MLLPLPEEAIENLDGKSARGIAHLDKNIVPIATRDLFDDVQGVKVANERQSLALVRLKLSFGKEGAH